MPPHSCDTPQAMPPRDAVAQDLESGLLDLQHGRPLYLEGLAATVRDVDDDPARVQRRVPLVRQLDLSADGAPGEGNNPGSISGCDDLVGDNEGAFGQGRSGLGISRVVADDRNIRQGRKDKIGEGDYE